jgi:hypothetical protein
MLKVMLKLAILFAIFTAVSIMIPDSITNQIDSAVIYFLSALWGLNAVLPVADLFSCLLIIVNFYAGVGIFFLLYSITHSTA